MLEGSSWETISSPSPFVAMSIKHAPKNTPRSIAVGKATAIIDCPALCALAWWFDFASRERMTISNEEKNPARLVKFSSTKHDNVVATIKAMPFPLSNREYVARQICAVDTNGDLLIIAASVDDVIDYGMSTRTVRGVSKALVRFVPWGESQCKVTYIQHADVGGFVPTWLINAKLPQALSAAVSLRREFQRDDEIDKLKREELAATIRHEPQTYTAEEDILVNKVNVKLGMLEWEHFEELESPDHLVKMGKMHAEGDGRMIVRASATIDSSIEECAASEMDKMSRKSTKGSTNLERSFVYDNGHCAVFRFAKALHIPGFAPREWVLRMLWKNSADTVVVCYESIIAQNEANSKYVRASSSVYNEYTRLEPLGGVPQTRVTWTQRFEMGGSISRKIVNALMPKYLVHLSRMRKQFDRSLEIDGATRAQNVAMIMAHADEYSAAEEIIIIHGQYHFSEFKLMKAKSLKMASPLTTAKIAYNSGDKHAWGWATTTVRARPEEVLAFLWDIMRRSSRRKDDLEKSMEQANGHNLLVYKKKRTPKIVNDRDFQGRVVWKKEGDGFVFVTSPEERDARPIADGVMRGKFPSAMKIKRKNGKESTFEYVFQIDFGGSLPAWLTNSYMSSTAGAVTEIQEYFQALKRLEEWDADDARAAGEVMCIKTKAEKHPEKGENRQSARMRELFSKYRGLGEIGLNYSFFQPMMTRVIENKLRTAGDVKSKLCSVSANEGRTIGAGLAMALASNLTAEAAVDEWVLKHKRILGELDKREDWFR